MGTARSTLFGLEGQEADPLVNPLLPKKPVVAGVPTVQQPSLLGMADPSAPTAQTLGAPATPAPPPVPAPMPQLDTTPDAGVQLSGADRYYDEATNAVRDKFALWNDEQFGRDTSGLEQQLRNRGIKPGDESYNRELNLLRDQQGKLRESSNLQAILTGGQEAERYLGMDDRAATSNLNRQLGVAGNTRAETELRREGQKYNDDKRAGEIGQGLDLLGKIGGNEGGGLLGLADRGIDALSAGVNKLTGGATTGLLTKGAGLLGLGGAPALGSAALGAELAAATNAAAPALSAAMAGGAAPAATTAATTAAGTAATGGGAMSTVLAAVPWVAGALAVAAVAANNMPKSSPMNKYDPAAGGWSKPENWGDESYPPESLNRVFGPALEAFKQSGGDVKAALAAVGQPQNALEKRMLERGLLHMFSGTGNPMRQIAEENNFGKGAWTAGSDEKKALLNELGIKQ